MKYTLDFEITKELEKKFGENLKKQAFANFCVSFVEQIKDKLSFKVEKIKTVKQVKCPDANFKEVEVQVYRFSIDFPKIREKKKVDEIIKKKPKTTYNTKESHESYEDERSKR